MLLEFLIENFNLTSFKNSEEKLHLYFEEQAKPQNNLLPLNWSPKASWRKLRFRIFR